MQPPHVEFAYNNSVSAATGLSPNEVHIGRLPRLPLTIFERTGVFGHQSLARDHLAYCDLATDRQQRAYDIVRQHHALTVPRAEWLSRYSTTVLYNRAQVWCKDEEGMWWLRSARAHHEGDIFGALFGRPGADHASSYSGALRVFVRSGTRFLVPTSTPR